MSNTCQTRRPCFVLVTEWVLTAPAERIWDALTAPDEWPRWWRYVERVDLVQRGDRDGIGAVHRYTWTSRLPYRLTFDMTTRTLAPPHAIEGVASGDLEGVGRWSLSARRRAVHVCYDWRVTPGKPWMRRLAPLFAPVFAWNHDQVMAAGGRGLAHHLGVPLLAHRRLSARRTGAAISM
ncbi:MAG: SRPBCC family protein [Rudaea sp.]